MRSMYHVPVRVLPDSLSQRAPNHASSCLTMCTSSSSRCSDARALSAGAILPIHVHCADCHRRLHGAPHGHQLDALGNQKRLHHWTDADTQYGGGTASVHAVAAKPRARKTVAISPFVSAAPVQAIKLQLTRQSAGSARRARNRHAPASLSRSSKYHNMPPARRVLCSAGTSTSSSRSPRTDRQWPPQRAHPAQSTRYLLELGAVHDPVGVQYQRNEVRKQPLVCH
ncbi:hypothetical protein FA95DRAFT_441711 [Auriscalpium vulgare]|uniref:Uncharacterized protein n=1 Tax=Auriscalpium vulgare TaxID=40419 RepID=A0ACB8RG08_9AGAM|nr:hypothetical protein FA95DRAFT_441711 [Auriscalpium vulgare]